MISEKLKLLCGEKLKRFRIPEKYRSPSLFWLIPILIAGALAWYWDQTGATAPGVIESESPDAADTFIPAGFVLVPIEVANSESLDSILGKFGVVDLYIPALEPGKRPIKVATRIKILRAPLNPNRFAVLAPEDESAQIVAHTGAFSVSVQNPKSSGTRFEPNREAGGETGEGSDFERRRGRSPAARARSRISIELEVPDAQ